MAGREVRRRWLSWDVAAGVQERRAPLVSGRGTEAVARMDFGSGGDEEGGGDRETREEGVWAGRSDDDCGCGDFFFPRGGTKDDESEVDRGNSLSLSLLYNVWVGGCRTSSSVASFVRSLVSSVRWLWCPFVRSQACFVRPRFCPLARPSKRPTGLAKKIDITQPDLDLAKIIDTTPLLESQKEKRFTTSAGDMSPNHTPLASTNPTSAPTVFNSSGNICESQSYMLMRTSGS